MKYKTNYTKDDYVSLIAECSVLESPNKMVDIVKSVTNLNKILSISDKGEFPEIWQARKFLIDNPDILVREMYKNIAGTYKEEILNFLNSLVITENAISIPTVSHYAKTHDSSEWYIMTCYFSISKIETTNLGVAGMLQDINLFSFILCHISKFKEFHHFDIYGRTR